MKKFDWNARLLTVAILLISLLGILLITRGGEPDFYAFILTLFATCSMFFCARFFPKHGVSDPLLITLVCFLGSFGTLYQYGFKIGLSGMMQGGFYLIGLFLFFGASRLTPKLRDIEGARKWIWLISVVVLVIPFMFDPVNKTHQWIPLGFIGLPISVQPSELVKALMIILLADILKDKNLPHPIFSACVIAASFIAIIILQRDYGAVLLYFVVAFTMIYIAAPKFRILAAGLTTGVASGFIMHHFSERIQKRFALLKNPFGSFAGDGYQPSLSLMALANGGSMGKGLGLGTGTSIPMYDTDFVFPVICEDFGFIFGLVLLLIYLLLTLRVLGIARRARTRHHAMIATACGVLIGFQTFLIVGGAINMVPLTGVTLPFISAGGSSTVTLMALLGVVAGIGVSESDASRGAYSIDYVADA